MVFFIIFFPRVGLDRRYIIIIVIATYVTNTYRVPARLFVVGGSELKSAEGTTQEDPLATVKGHRYSSLSKKKREIFTP